MQLEGAKPAGHPQPGATQLHPYAPNSPAHSWRARGTHATSTGERNVQPGAIQPVPFAPRCTDVSRLQLESAKPAGHPQPSRVERARTPARTQGLVPAAKHNPDPGTLDRVTQYRVRSADGTLIAAWRNDADGIPLLICNGLASSPAAWPTLRGPDSGFDARTWWHRGIPPSEVPQGGIEMADQVADALAVVEDAGWDRYLVVGWSLGVNIALELAAEDERVAGVLALAGVPGGTFDEMLPLPFVPRDVAVSLVGFATALLQATGSRIGALVHRLGESPTTADLLKSTGAIGASADIAQVRELVRDFLGMDVHWYGRLAGALRRHRPMDVSGIDCPVVYVSAEQDFVTDPAAVEAAANRTPKGRAERWDATHFLVLEYPDRVRQALLDLAAEVGVG